MVDKINKFLQLPDDAGTRIAIITITIILIVIFTTIEVLRKRDK